MAQDVLWSRPEIGLQVLNPGKGIHFGRRISIGRIKRFQNAHVIPNLIKTKKGFFLQKPFYFLGD